MSDTNQPPGGSPGQPGAPRLPGPGAETLKRAPREAGKRRPGAFQLAETKPPDRGRSLEEGLAELARQRAAGAADTGGRTRRGRGRGETYTAPDGTRIELPAPAAAPPAPASPVGLILPTPAPVVASPVVPTPAAQPMAPAPTPAVPALAGGDPQQLVAVTIDGQTGHLPLGEIVAGYLRQRDYSAKTQQAAQQLKIAQDSHTQFNVARERLEQRLGAMLALDADEFSRPVDWIALSKTDPIGYSQKHARFLARQEMLAEQQRLAELRQKEELGRKQYALATGHAALAQILPHWNDPAQRQALQQGMLDHLRLRGFTQEEIDRRELADPRDIIILLEAMLWARHIGQGAMQPNPQPAVGTLAGNGTGAAPLRNGGAPPAAVEALDDRFGRTRKLDDAVALLQARRRASGSA